MPFIPETPKIKAFQAYDAGMRNLPPKRWWSCSSNGRYGIGRTLEGAYRAWEREIDYAVRTSVASRWGSYTYRSRDSTLI